MRADLRKTAAYIQQEVFTSCLEGRSRVSQRAQYLDHDRAQIEPSTARDNPPDETCKEPRQAIVNKVNESNEILLAENTHKEIPNSPSIQSGPI